MKKGKRDLFELLDNLYEAIPEKGGYNFRVELKNLWDKFNAFGVPENEWVYWGELGEMISKYIRIDRVEGAWQDTFLEIWKG